MVKYRLRRKSPTSVFFIPRVAPDRLSKDAISNIYSPTHKINIGEKEDWDVSISWGKEDYLPKHPFVLYYQLAEDQLGASLIAPRLKFGLQVKIRHTGQS